MDFYFDSLDVKDLTINGTTFKVFELKDGGVTSIPGEPQMPFKRKIVYLPDGFSSADISFDAGAVEIYSNVDVAPAPDLSEPLISDIEQNFQKKYQTSGVYSEDKNFPVSVAEVEDIVTVRGKKAAVIRVFPVQYNPALHKIKTYRDISVRLTITASAAFSPLVSSVDKSADQTAMQYPLLKISVNKNAMYKLTGSDMKQYGFKLKSINPRTLKLFYKGDEVPIIVKSKKRNKFSSKDYVQFYGVKNSSEYSDISVYWLSAGGENGKRLTYKNKNVPGTGSRKKYFIKEVKEEKNEEFIQTLPKEEGKEHWFWERIYGGDETSYNFDILNLSSLSNELKINISLQGLYDDIENDPDHNTTVSVNGTKVSEFSWEGEEEETRTITSTTSVLKEGKNTLSIKEGSGSDYMILNYFTISYPSKIKAVNNELYFTGAKSGKNTYKVSGVKGKRGTVKVYDITDSSSVKLLKFKKKGKTVTFTDMAEPEAEYLVTTSESARAPSSVENKSESANLKDTSNGADYVIITHDKFANQANSIAQMYQNEGMRVKVIKIGDVYDEFGYGFYDPQAIKDFLSYAYNNWQTPAPSYVLLFGDANFDYRNYLNSDIKDYIPVKLVHTTSFGPTPSDTWYACVDGEDNIPDMYIGRIPASSTAEADTAVSKITAYKGLSSGEDWFDDVLLVADDPDEGGDFEALSDALESELPVTYYTVQKVYLGEFSTTAEAKSSLISGINNGAVVVSYAGHGSVTDWAAEELFTPSDISSLTNSGKYPLVINLNCLTGYFASAYDEKSLGEEFLKAPNSGAVAFWGPTGLGYNSEYQDIGKELFSTIFNDENDMTIGESVIESLVNAYTDKGVSEDYFKDMVLLGDPALKLKKPQ